MNTVPIPPLRMWTFFKKCSRYCLVCSWCFLGVAYDCLNGYMREFEQGASSSSSSVCGRAGNLLALGLDDLTLWPAELCDGRNMLLHFVFFDFCCGPSGSLEHRKNDCHIVPNGKVHDAHVFGPCVLAATASSWCWRALEAVMAPWSVQPNRYGDEDTTRVGGGQGLPACLCKSSHESERVTVQIYQNTLSTVHAYNGTWSTSKKKTRWSIANPRR